MNIIDFPPEILERVFIFLDPVSALLVSTSVCKYFRRVSLGSLKLWQTQIRALPFGEMEDLSQSSIDDITDDFLALAAKRYIPCVIQADFTRYRTAQPIDYSTSKFWRCKNPKLRANLRSRSFEHRKKTELTIVFKDDPGIYFYDLEIPGKAGNHPPSCAKRLSVPPLWDDESASGPSFPVVKPLKVVQSKSRKMLILAKSPIPCHNLDCAEDCTDCQNIIYATHVNGNKLYRKDATICGSDVYEINIPPRHHLVDAIINDSSYWALLFKEDGRSHHHYLMFSTKARPEVIDSMYLYKTYVDMHESTVYIETPQHSPNLDLFVQKLTFHRCSVSLECITWNATLESLQYIRLCS
jgi:hypothetical protein